MEEMNTNIDVSVGEPEVVDDRTARQWMAEKRFRLLVQFLRETQALTEDHARRLAQFVIFPAPPSV